MPCEGRFTRHVTFGLHPASSRRSVSQGAAPLASTLDRAITRIQDVYDLLVRKTSESFLGDTTNTQGQQGTVSSVVLENEKRILQSLKEIKNLLSQHAPQLLEVFKMMSLLTRIVENFFSERTAGLYHISICSSSLIFDLAGP